MGFLDQFPVWQQAIGAAVILVVLTAILFWLVRLINRDKPATPPEASSSDSSAGTGGETYAPMFRRVVPPTQPVAVAPGPDTARVGLSATTSTPSRTPTKSVPVTEPAAREHVSSPATSSVPLSMPIAPPAVTPRPPMPPGVAAIPQRAIKIQPRTGAPIGDISAKPVTASIGTRLSVLSLSVVDKPYAKPQLKPSETTGTVGQAVGGPDPSMVRASAPVRVMARDITKPGSSSSVVRELPAGALANMERPPTATSPVPTLNVTTSPPSTSRIVPGKITPSDALSRFAAQMQGGGETAPASAAATPAPVKPPVPAPRPMTATVPTVSPRMPTDPAATTAGPNTVQLTIGFEIASLQLTPALKLGAVQIRPTSNIVSVQLDSTSQATLQRLLAGGTAGNTPAFEIEKLELTSGGKIALITLAPKK